MLSQFGSKANWIAAIDGGGSKVAGILAERSALPHVASTTTVRHFQSGTGSAALATWPIAHRNLSSVFSTLLERASIGSDQVDHLVLMMAGAGRSDDVARVTEALASNPVFNRCARITVTSDIQPLLTYARDLEPQLPTIVAIAGTGSLIASVDAEGQVVRAGGWGPVLGDEGSGWRIAHRALQAACRSLDSANPHAKSHELLDPEFLKSVVRLAVDHKLISDPSQLPSALIALASDRHLAAQLAPHVLNIAEQSSESLEHRIVCSEMNALAEQVSDVHRRIGAPSHEWRLAVAGGLAVNNSFFREELNKRLHQRGIEPQHVNILDPLEAALHFAART